MVLLQIIQYVHTCNLDTAFVVRATLQKVRTCYRLKPMQPARRYSLLV
jgi:hypothetical protein